MSDANVQRDILTIEEAAELLGVSVKTFNKVLHSQDLPARKIGREWKFSRAALIAWVGSGRSKDFYQGHGEDDDDTPSGNPEKARRTAGWKIEY
ncbi:MAG: helix-turn-helix domain-containing protein [Planctomycetota bacterium]|nr:helix-turn-helix domain-containing protein [Planctomycetota bacterium]